MANTPRSPARGRTWGSAIALPLKKVLRYMLTPILIGAACFLGGVIFAAPIHTFFLKRLVLPIAKLLDKGTGELHDAILKAEEALKK